MNDVQLRCPQCSALLRGHELWCSLCHADLRPQAEPAEPPAPVLEPDAPDPLTAPVEELLAAQARLLAAQQQLAALQGAPDPDPGPAPAPEAEGAAAAPDQPRGKHARRGATDDGALADPEVMLALLRADSRDPVLTKFGGRLEDPTSRFVVMVGGTALLAALLFGLYTLLGLLVG